jgi:competence protein ComEC
MRPKRRLPAGFDPFAHPRHVILAGAALGLALSPLGEAGPPVSALPVLAAIGLVAVTAPARASTVLLALLACVVGLGIGAARLHAIDAGALQAAPERGIELRGVLTAPPRQQAEGTALELMTPAGRVQVLTRAPTDDLHIGGEVSVRGRTAEPQPWQAGTLRRRGIATVIEAEEIHATGGRRGGLSGRLDVVRRRAEIALERGMPEPQAALARGFVLGQDDRIDSATRSDFRRSGLTHLLAVSGQNVVLLCLLAWPLLAFAGLTLRARLLVLLALIAVYVPVTGAGASIQRAGIMGAAGLAAALAGTPRSRWYAVLLAAAVTLALNPRVSGDVGWQLSFAAVIGILIWSRPLADLLARGAERSTPSHAIAEGAAVTIAATLATAPLMAHHFNNLSLAALPANLLALPAVAPAMWLGMLSGIAGQIPAIPVEPLNWLNSLCLAYIAQVAHWFGAPDWALLGIGLESWLAVAAAYAGLLLGMTVALAWAGRRAGLRSRRWGSRADAGASPKSSQGPSAARPALRRCTGGRPLAATAGLALLFVLAAGVALHQRAGSPQADDKMRISVLDVGQGDAILLDPPRGEPVLVDTGPPGDGIGDILREHGAESLAAVVVTHDQSDHAGGLQDVLRSVPVQRFGYGEDAPEMLAAARAAGVEPLRLTEGGELRSGELRLEVLWPPAEVLGQGGDPNLHSLVIVAVWRHFSMLLTGDAEAESTPIDPGAVDVLKVGHHGSEDSGLGGLLDHMVPALAVISVGDHNPYGHPTDQTLAELSEHHVLTERTDEDGEIDIEADASGWRLRP